jgi:uncharacterized protein (TIGR01777 family)
VSLGPLRIPWRSEITAVEDGRSFLDVQLAGPFAEWEHTHAMQPASGARTKGVDAPSSGDGGHASRSAHGAGRASGSVLEDRIRYRLPLGPLGAVFGGPFARRKLERMFTYRHAVTRQDLAWHAAADAKPLTVLVTGASGMVGSALVPFLTTGGHHVRKLVRRAPRSADEFRWDPDGLVDPRAFEGVDAVVHLAGENIASGRWTAARKRRIERSRVDGTRRLVQSMRAARPQPPVLVCASAVGFYGDRGDEELDEQSPAGTGFLADVCEAWETEARAYTGGRSVQLRLGVVLGASGGALAKMLLPFQLGAGGRLGHGRQWMSWVALDDVIGAFHHALVTPELQGPVNVVAPNPVTNAEFTRTLGRVLRRPTIVPAPAFGVRALLGEMADELLLASMRALPRRLQQTGYAFAQPELEGALRHQLGRAEQRAGA